MTGCRGGGAFHRNLTLSIGSFLWNRPVPHATWETAGPATAPPGRLGWGPCRRRWITSPIWPRSSRRRRRRSTPRPRGAAAGRGGVRRAGRAADFEVSPGGHYLVRDGALVAWRVPAERRARVRRTGSSARTPTRPASRSSRQPDLGGYGWQQLGVEVYGGPLLNSWLDRELGLAGRVVLADGRVRLVRTEAIMRIPQLAIHLDRGGQRQRAEAGQAAAHRAGLERRPARTAGARPRRGARSAATATRSTASTWWPTTPPRRRCSVRTGSSWPRAGWTT